MTSEIEFGKYEGRGAYHWGQISRSMHRHNAFVSARYDAVLAALGELDGQLVLDIGGGDGALSYLIAKRGPRTVTLDASRMALRYARQEFRRRGLQAQVVEASACSLPFPSAAFDIAVCSDVIEHIRCPDKLISEAVRILRPGGRFVLTTPVRITEKPLNRMHVHEFFPDELKRLLETALSDVAVRGFAPVALQELFLLPIPWLRGRPLFRYLFNAASIYLGRNPFAGKGRFRLFSMLLATGRKE